MNRLKKLLASALIVSSILAISSVGVFAEVNSTPIISQQQFSVLGGMLPRGDKAAGEQYAGQVGAINNEIFWVGSYDKYQISIREWGSLASFQANYTSGGSATSYDVLDVNSLDYEFTSGHVYRVWVYGIDAGKKFTVGAYEWQE